MCIYHLFYFFPDLFFPHKGVTICSQTKPQPGLWTRRQPNFLTWIQTNANSHRHPPSRFASCIFITCTFARTHTCTHMHTHTYTHVRTHTDTPTHTRTHNASHKYTRTHIVVIVIVIITISKCKAGVRRRRPRSPQACRTLWPSARVCGPWPSGILPGGAGVSLSLPPAPGQSAPRSPVQGAVRLPTPQAGGLHAGPRGLPAHREALPCPRLLSSSLASVTTLKSPHTSGRRTGRSSLSNKTVNQRSLVHASLKQLVPESSAGRCNPSQTRIRKERDLPVRLL